MHGGIFKQLNILVDHTCLYRGMSYSDAAKWELVGSVKACFIFIDILIQQNSFLILWKLQYLRRINHESWILCIHCGKYHDERGRDEGHFCI